MVEGALQRQTLDQRRIGSEEANLVPADVRELQRPRSSTRTSPETMPETARPAELGGGVEGQLHPQADTEHRRARREALAQQLVQAELAQVVHRAREGPHAGQDEPGRRAQPVVLRADARARADVLERLLHRAAVAHAVVDDGDVHGLGEQARHAVSVPFVLGTPVSVGSIATAWRSARAKALKAASIMWWALLPVFDAQVQRELGGVGQRAEELLGELVVEAAGGARRQIGLEQREADGRRCRSRSSPAPRPSARSPQP